MDTFPRKAWPSPDRAQMARIRVSPGIAPHSHSAGRCSTAQAWLTVVHHGSAAAIDSGSLRPLAAARNLPVASLIQQRVGGSHNPPILMRASSAASLAVACSPGRPTPKAPVPTWGWTLPAILPAETAPLRWQREVLRRALPALIPPQQRRGGEVPPRGSPFPPQGDLPCKCPPLYFPPGAILQLSTHGPLAPAPCPARILSSGALWPR